VISITEFQSGYCGTFSIGVKTLYKVNVDFKEGTLDRYSFRGADLAMMPLVVIK